MSVAIALAFVSVVAMAADQPTPLPKPTGAEAAVHAAHKKYADNWNKHDIKTLAATWTEDADYTEPDGRTVFGRAQIERLLGYEHASVFKESELTLVVERVRFITDGVALADGSYELFNARDPSGRKIGVRSGYFTSVLVKDDGAWMVTGTRLMLPQVLIWREKYPE